ncbi:MAG: DUF1700 domain-containing protein [Saccharofermentanales bacterium]
MNKTEFTNELSRRIGSLPQNEIEKAVAYYDEMINDRIEEGMPEEAAVAALGDLNSIAGQVMYDMSLPTLMKARVSESKKKASNKGLWIILVILGFPIWLPLLISFIAILFSIYITIWALIFSLYAVVLSLGIAGIAGLAGGFVYFFMESLPTGLVIIGASIFCCGLTLLLIKPMLLMTKGLMHFTYYIARKIKSLFITQKEVAK